MTEVMGPPHPCSEALRQLQAGQVSGQKNSGSKAPGMGS